MKATWLFDEHPLVIDKELAKVIGLNEAIVLQQVNYWLHGKHAKRIEGRLWTYNSMKKWHEQFPFWGLNTVKRTFSSLEESGLLIAGNYNKYKFDKTKWYSIDDEKLNNRMAQNGSMENTKMGHSDWPKMGQPIPDTTDTTTDTNKYSASHSNAPSVSQLESDFEEIWQKYPNKKGKQQAFNHYKAWRKKSVQHTNEYLLNKLNEYLKYCHQNSSWYHPMNGSTWFNGRFDDELDKDTPVQKKRVYW